MHVGVVLPGFVSTEGFPHGGCSPARARAGWSRRPEQVARGDRRRRARAGKREVYVPRFYVLVPKLRHLFPRLTRRTLGGGRL